MDRSGQVGSSLGVATRSGRVASHRLMTCAAYGPGDTPTEAVPREAA